MIIKNFEQLATSALRKQVLEIAEAGLQAINTGQAFRQGFVYDAQKDRLQILDRRYDLSKFHNVYCLAFGKAAIEGIVAVSEILGSRLTSGFAIGLEGEDGLLGRPRRPSSVLFRFGTHPHPSPANVRATKELLQFISGARENDLVLCLISGGGSALLCLPHTLTVETQAAILKALMNAGADIFELNCVRKHLSRVKGGQLAKLIYPAKLISLIVSDVPGDDLSVIASGPTVRDETTVREASCILNKYHILEKLNIPSVSLLETPKEEKYFKHAENILFLSARTAIAAMREKAEDLGYDVKIFSHRQNRSSNYHSWGDHYAKDPGTQSGDTVSSLYFQGDAEELAMQIIQANDRKNQCLLGAGESTVVVKGAGQGGRNQHLALAALTSLSENQILIALTSDGYDNSDSAGAIVDASTVMRAKNLGLNPHQYLENNDSFTFFQEVGDNIHTGFTGSNVADLVICLKG